MSLLKNSADFAAQSSEKHAGAEPVHVEVKRLPQHWKPGQSGNPKGRPKGLDFRALVQAKHKEYGLDLEESMWQVYLSLLASALGGDMQAAKLLLDRLCSGDTEPLDMDRRALSDTERVARIARILAIAEARAKLNEELDEIL